MVFTQLRVCVANRKQHTSYVHTSSIHIFRKNFVFPRKIKNLHVHELEIDAFKCFYTKCDSKFGDKLNNDGTTRVKNMKSRS